MKHALILALSLALLAGCKKSGIDNTSAPTSVHHEHKPPHGGTPVVLGNEEYHLELVLIRSEGKVQAFVMDGELENFVRIPAKMFEVEVKLADKNLPLIFNAVPNRATGETVGDTSAFEASSYWLKTNATFDAVLKELTIRTKLYQNVQFNFPKGNDSDEKN
jgi:hypothetical protein